jgi:peptide/nickel transport system ATP-binding protein
MTAGADTAAIDQAAVDNDVVLEVRDLSVEFQVGGTAVPAVSGVSFAVHRGEVLALVGESGSGKSVSSLSVLGLLAPNARVQGSIRFNGGEISQLRGEPLRALRGKRIAMIFQEPMTALNPVYTIGQQIIEAIRSHENVTEKKARERALQLLRLVEIPEPERRMNSYPHQLSGGQRQRAMIAMAVSGSPDVIIADEPTTALDVTVQADILDLLRRLQKDLGAAVLLITHDMGVVAELADRVVVMRSGTVVEAAPVRQIFEKPEAEYTAQLLAAVPRPSAQQEVQSASDRELSVEVSGLDVVYPGGLGRKPFHAVHRVDLAIRRGSVHGLVGESGSGKSTIGRAIAGLLRPAAGTVRIGGIDPYSASRADRRRLRRSYSMVFQDPGSSLNPRLSIGDSVAAPMQINKFGSRTEIRNRVSMLLDSVEISSGWADRFPHELSGGQRQRIGIARALALDPEFLIADEPTSALDVSVQATVLALLSELQERLGFSCLFISHDLAVIELLSDQVTVLQHGRVVESGPAGSVLRSPSSDYTKRLIAAAPVPDPVAQAERRRAWQAMSA